MKVTKAQLLELLRAIIEDPDVAEVMGTEWVEAIEKVVQ
jgi:hypothetical protein